MILDLRYNPGGLLTAGDRSVRQVPRPTALIVSTRADRDDRRTSRPSPTRQARRTTSRDLPLVVLVNQYSASASEIVSGA